MKEISYSIWSRGSILCCSKLDDEDLDACYDVMCFR